MIRLSVTEASRGFSDLINKVRYLGETATLYKAGKAVACVVPIAPVCTGADLLRNWSEIPHLDPADAELMEEEINSAREKLPVPSSSWD